MRAPELARPASILIAAVIGLIAGACGPHSDYRIEKVCKNYCERVIDCNDNADYNDCVDTCIDTANDCDSDSDVEQSLDLLEECTAESCNDVGACSVDAWLECAF